jgi:hypothetical protein
VTRAGCRDVECRLRFKLLRDWLPQVLRAIAPLIGVVCVLQLAFVRAPAAQFVQFLAGSVLVVAGMLLLLAGIDHGIPPWRNPMSWCSRSCFCNSPSRKKRSC